MLKSTALAVMAPMAAPMINRGRFGLFAQGTPEYSTRTVDLVRESTVIDMLGLLTLNYRKMFGWQTDPSKFTPADFQRLKNSGINVFHPAVGYLQGDIYAQSRRDIVGWNEFLSAHPSEFVRMDRAADFEAAKAAGKIGIVIGQQNSEHFRTVDDVDGFYRLGQRVSQLSYNSNRLGGGSPDGYDPGLSVYGAQIVERMNRVGMAVDVSHCGERTTLDALEASKKPVLVTHSNCRTLVPGSRRCKTDEAIRTMAKKGGVIGITMVRTFVRSGHSANMEDVLDHIDHVARLTGMEFVGVGSDVDLDGRDLHSGPRYDLDGIDYSKKVYDLTEGLIRRDYSRRGIQLILGGNFERALSEIWTA